MENSNTRELPADKIREAAKDDFVIGNGFVIADDTAKPSHANVKSGKKKKSKKKTKGVAGAIIRIVAIFGISLILAVSVILLTSDYLGIGFNRGKEVVVEIPKGATVRQIGSILKDVDAVSSPFLFRMYSKVKGYSGKYKYGVYTFNNEAGYEELARMLIEEGAVAESVRVTIPERASVDEIAKLLEEKGICEKADFITALDDTRYEYDFVKDIPSKEVYYRLEGYLFPDTYDFYNYSSKECAVLAVEKMLARTNEIFEKIKITDKIKDGKYSLHDIMTLASIVELEASGNPDEMVNVAQVFYNRLEKWEVPLLGSTPTAKYKHGNGRYDTNKSQGLPPGPLCSPSEAAIKAAINPNTECTATYFVTDAQMKFYYTHSLSEHNSTIARLKAAKNWIYESID